MILEAVVDTSQNVIHPSPGMLAFEAEVQMKTARVTHTLFVRTRLGHYLPTHLGFILAQDTWTRRENLIRLLLERLPDFTIWDLYLRGQFCGLRSFQLPCATFCTQSTQNQIRKKWNTSLNLGSKYCTFGQEVVCYCSERTFIDQVWFPRYIPWLCH